MKIFLIIFAFVYNSLDANENKKEIKYDGYGLNISKNIFIMEDESKNLKEEDIVKGLYDKDFKAYNRGLLYLWNTKVDYYIKIDVLNNTKKNELELYGWFGPITLTSTDISIIYLDKGKLVKNKFTRKIKKEDKKDLLNYGCSSFRISPNESKTIYIKSKSFLFFTTPLILTEIENIIESERGYFSLTNVLNGMSILILLGIIVLYIKLRKNYLLYYVFIFIFNYFKSELFFKYVTRYIDFTYAEKIYSISVMLYVFSLVNFAIEIFKLDTSYKNFKNYLNILKYSSVLICIQYSLGLINAEYFFKTKDYLYLGTFNLILYLAIIRYKDGWIYKALLFSWIPNWALYTYMIIAYQFKLKIITFDVRIDEYLEIFINLFLIAVVLFYDAKELWKNRNRVEESDKFVKTLNKSENLMHALMNLVELYKKEIKHDRVMYFRRKLSRERDDLLFYDFSIPSIGDERQEEKKYHYLTKILHEDKFRTYFICNDIELSDLYKSILPEYKSMIVIRLSVVNETDLGYIIVLSKDRVEYEYNETLKDFRYKISLLVQHFKTIDEIKEKYETRVVEETIRRFHIEILNDSKKDAEKILDAVSEAKRILNKLVSDKDPRMGKLSDHLFEEIELKVKNIIEDLNFEDINKKTKNKILFKYKVIEEWIKVIEEALRKISNKVTVDVKHEVNNSYLLEGHLQIVENIINYFLSYIYNRVNKESTDTLVRIKSRIEDGRLVIKGIIEGIYITSEELQKEYRDEVQRVLLNRIRSKKYLRAKDGKIEITYMLNILTKEERDKANIKYLDYESTQDQDEMLIEEYESEVKAIKKTRKKLN